MNLEPIFPWLLSLNGAASAMAALVLAAAPGAIPGMVGIAVAPSQHFIIHLLAAAELALAAMSVGAVLWRSRKTDYLAGVVLVTVHIGAIIAGLVAYSDDGNAIIGLNVVARSVIVVALIVAIRAFPPNGRAR